MASQLRGYLRDKPAGLPVWPSGKWGWHTQAAAMLRVDLAAAGVPYSADYPDRPRFANFHALRHSFLTTLAGSGVGVKELQELARHSTPMLTLGLYAHAWPEALGAAVARLPLPGENPSPLSTMSRDQLEAAFALLLTLASGLFAPPLAPVAGIPGDSPTLAGTKKRRKAV